MNFLFSQENTYDIIKTRIISNIIFNNNQFINRDIDEFLRALFEKDNQFSDGEIAKLRLLELIRELKETGLDEESTSLKEAFNRNYGPLYEREGTISAIQNKFIAHPF